MTPDGAAIARKDLWNKAEKAEKRKDGTPARLYQIALPHELTPEERIELVREFARGLMKRHGCAVDIAIHAPSDAGDDRNYHAHVLTTTRVFKSGELTEKCALEKSDTDRAKLGLPGRLAELETTRAAWSQAVNSALERAQIDDRVSHLSFAAQGIDRLPMLPSRAAIALERKGIRTDIGLINQQRKLYNQQRQPIKKETIYERERQQQHVSQWFQHRVTAKDELYHKRARLAAQNMLRSLSKRDVVSNRIGQGQECWHILPDHVLRHDRHDSDMLRRSRSDRIILPEQPQTQAPQA